MTSIVKDKRYRVSYECVAQQDIEYNENSGYLGTTFPIDYRTNHTFEEIIPPLKPFEVGDFARNTSTGNTYLITDKGCVLVAPAWDCTARVGTAYQDGVEHYNRYRSGHEHVDPKEIYG